MQGDPPPRPGHGHLRQPAPQAAPGLTYDLHLLHRRRDSRDAHTYIRRARPPIGGDDTPGGGRGPVRYLTRPPGTGTAEDLRHHQEPHTWHAFQALTSRARSAWRSPSPMSSASGARAPRRS
ncbi:hypothetical protein SBRY_10254 [Actinacidiphila bryophytorum]|uniref:Uncharacterized protein n=1 Tax=Actinacidiphila bryophytorum TaxID=1436133 RepID=A0A9W4E5Z2_9ACTN|nr:hypothetical protein SBRY_10254 [Actinacidiphila bryophytorum]